MASSSSGFLKNMKQQNFIVDHEEEEKVAKVGQEEEEEEEDWLKLGLGLLGSDDHHKNIGHGSSQLGLAMSIEQQHQEVVGVELGLGFEGGPSSSSSRLLGLSMVEPTSSSGASFHHHHHHHNHNHSNDGIKLWPSVPFSHDHDHDHPHQQCGLWFTLRSSTNRSGEALPQIPKAYIRVRDENMTVLMVKKYLVGKLGLSNEAEIDISCMGQSLSHRQTLKEVRDSVWLPQLIESLDSTTLSLGDSHDHDHIMSLNHIMSLLYRKHCLLN